MRRNITLIFAQRTAKAFTVNQPRIQFARHQLVDGFAHVFLIWLVAEDAQVKLLLKLLAGFNELYRDGRITEAACWAHARRKIHDVHVRTPSALTEEALKRIGELYAIEAEIRGMTAEQRLAERQLKTKPLLKSLESWLREKMKTLSRHSELAKAFAYALNQWPALTYYADDGWAEADNNIAENALRMVSLGRKNYLFFGSDHGGERGALLYSLIGTCKLNGVEPESYLRYVLDVIADWPINRVGELLPWRVALPTE